MDLDAWYDHARRDAAEQGMPALEPLLRMLQRATRALRAADWAREVPRGGASGGSTGSGAAGGEDTRGGDDRGGDMPGGDAAGGDDRGPRARGGDDRGAGARGGDAAGVDGPGVADGIGRSHVRLPRIVSPRTTIVDLAAALRRREVTSAALVEDCLAAIATHDDSLNAFLLVRGNEARAEARSADRELARGVDRGPLHGIPISLKDVIDLAGSPTTAATAARATHRAAVDAAVVARLRAAGAIIIGKCNLHELAFGTTGEASARGPTRNPHDARHVAGGSSSGSAVSVSTGMALASIGTDTGGSIRIPASACGVVGLKPTFGEVSTDGVFPLAPSLDHVGPIARSVRDAETVFRILRGPAGGAAPGGPPAGVASRPRLGVPRRYFLDLLEPAVDEAFRAAVERLEAAGCRIEEADVAHAADAGPVYLHTQLPEASACHGGLLDGAAKPSEEVRLRLALGRCVPAEDYVRAQRGRAVLTREVDAALEHRDALLLPALAIVPPRLGVDAVTVGDVTEAVRPLTLRLTQLFDLTGHPAIAIPCGRAGGLPTGLQLVGRRNGTDALLALAAAYEPTIRGNSGNRVSDGGVSRQ